MATDNYVRPMGVEDSESKRLTVPEYARELRAEADAILERHGIDIRARVEAAVSDRRADALRLFTEYVVANYPPGSCITFPEWHAGKLFRAALQAIDGASAANTYPGALAAVGGGL